ncbi:hypothetical protein FRC20_008479 [Serendipita sp. 405]|nr:hypothetical protein FRC15_007944 [Serendipita sp. 397]KAG8830158.1 hypothetical protein FRC20_008479 [Serendipita sp. 405]
MIQGNTASTVPWLEDLKPLLFNGLEKFARQPTKRPRLYYARPEIGMPSNPHPGYGIVNRNSNTSNTHHHHHPTVSITVVSDFNCPWCYVAHKEAQSALTQARISHPNTLFTVEYRPFQLDPTLPTEKPMC